MCLCLVCVYTSVFVHESLCEQFWKVKQTVRMYVCMNKTWLAYSCMCCESVIYWPDWYGYQSGLAYSYTNIQMLKSTTSNIYNKTLVLIVYFEWQFYQFKALPTCTCTFCTYVQNRPCAQLRKHTFVGKHDLKHTCIHTDVIQEIWLQTYMYNKHTCINTCIMIHLYKL
jgi:hypothetical protein